ncbi:MAG: MATE family efflux transporter [Acidobacteriota bacterium]
MLEPRTHFAGRLASLRQEIRQITTLSLPILGSQLGFMLLWTVDVAMLGAFSTESLDAAALGRLWISGTLIFGFGLLLGNDPLISQAHGAGDQRSLDLALHRGLALAGLISVPLALLWLLTGPVLLVLGQETALAHEAHRYVMTQIPTLPLAMAFSALRQFLIGRGIMLPGLYVSLLAVVVNIGANWILIYGHWGAPALGHVGAGLATAMTQVFMLVALVLFVRVRGLCRFHRLVRSSGALSLRGLLPVVRLGLPIALQLGLGTWTFQTTTLMAGWLGRDVLAANTVLLTLSGMAFMVPLAISIGTSTRVGHLIGARRPEAARNAAWASLALACGVMASLAGLLLLTRAILPTLFTNDLHVAALAAAVLPVVAAFQLADGLQAIGGGILRAMGRTRAAAVFNLAGYYLLALPLAGWLALHQGHGLMGIWTGLAIGLTVVAGLLVAWLRRNATLAMTLLTPADPPRDPAPKKAWTPTESSVKPARGELAYPGRFTSLRAKRERTWVQ